MPPKRKTQDSTAKAADPEPPSTEPEQKDEIVEGTAAQKADSGKLAKERSSKATTDNTEDDAAAKAHQRQERFKALQARAVSICQLLLSYEHFQCQVLYLGS